MIVQLVDDTYYALCRLRVKGFRLTRSHHFLTFPQQAATEAVEYLFRIISVRR